MDAGRQVAVAQPATKKPLFKRNAKLAAKAPPAAAAADATRPTTDAQEEDEDDLRLFKRSDELLPSLIKDQQAALKKTKSPPTDDPDHHGRKRRKVPTDQDGSDSDPYDVSDRELERIRNAKLKQTQSSPDNQSRGPTTPDVDDSAASPGSSARKRDKGKGLAAPYSLATPAKSSRSPQSTSTSRASAEKPVITLSSSEDEDTFSRKRRRSPASPVRAGSKASIAPSKPPVEDANSKSDADGEDFASVHNKEVVTISDPEEEEKEEEDTVNPEYASFIIAAKQRREALKASAAAKPSADGVADGARTTSPEDIVIKIFVTSSLGGPDMTPILVQRRLVQTIGLIRMSFISHAPSKGRPLTDEEKDAVFLTWKGRKVFDSATLLSLGVMPDAKGVYRASGYPGSRVLNGDGFHEGLIHFEAWTPAAFEAWEREKEWQRRRAEGEILSGDEMDQDDAAEGGEDDHAGGKDAKASSGDVEKRMRILLKSKNHEVFKITAYPATAVSVLMRAFRNERLQGDTTKEVSIHLDGDRLNEDTLLGDTEIEDQDSLEVYVK